MNGAVSTTREGSAIKLVYIITDLEIGGVPLHLYRLALAMRQRGYQPTVVSLAGAGPVGQRLRQADIPVSSCEGRGGSDFRVLRRLTRILRDLRPDVVHAFLFHANIAVRLCARRAAVPVDRVICEIQTVELKRRWHLTVDQWTHRLCRMTIGNSPSVIEHLATRARIPRARLRLVRGGIDASPYRNAKPVDPSSLGVRDQSPVILWTGRLDPVKGLFFLLDAFQIVQRLAGAHLLLAGGGPLLHRLRRRITRLGLDGAVHLLGVRDDVAALLKAADLYLLPSRAEGLPNALLEAMAAGCPIVTTDVPGCRDLITHQRTGLLVSYGNVEQLAAAMMRLLRDRPMADRLARAASEEVRKHWSITATIDGYDSVYRDILGTR